MLHILYHNSIISIYYIVRYISEQFTQYMITLKHPLYANLYIYVSALKYYFMPKQCLEIFKGHYLLCIRVV